jgi:hypothetical protein
MRVVVVAAVAVMMVVDEVAVVQHLELHLEPAQMVTVPVLIYDLAVDVDRMVEEEVVLAV